MAVFKHLLYEILKGIRPLCFCTCRKSLLLQIEKQLSRNGIDYRKYKVNNDKYNVLFGKSECLEVLDLLSIQTLASLSPEEDFMLGTMLGYDCAKQCARYKKLKKGQGSLRASG